MFSGLVGLKYYLINNARRISEKKEIFACSKLFLQVFKDYTGCAVNHDRLSIDYASSDFSRVTLSLCLPDAATSGLTLVLPECPGVGCVLVFRRSATSQN